MGGGGGGVFKFGGVIFKWGVHPIRRGIGFDGAVFEKKNVGWGVGRPPHAPHACSKELKKCPPPFAAVQRFVNVVRERKPR